MKVINNSPKIYTIDNYLSDEDCEHFINLSRNKIQPATVSGDKSGYISEGRTGGNNWIAHYTDSITERIGLKIAKEIGIPLENSESFQVVYYDKTQQYKQHYDAWLFDDSEKSKRNMKYGGQRIITALVYLNNVESGGETKFTKLNFEVKPEKRKLLVFENVYTGTNYRHELSEHAGMPVIEGEKWIFNLWFREISRKEIFDYSKGLKSLPLSLSLSNPLNNINFNTVNKEANYKIKKYENILSSDDLLKIIINSSFENKDRSSAWINNEKIKDIISKLEKLLKIDSAYFENICVTKYLPKVVHGDHLDSYDMTTGKGKENTRETGQRLMTITGFFTDTNVTFPKLHQNFKMSKGELLVYDNCYSETNNRDENMIKNYAAISSEKDSFMLLFNIYVREKSRIKDGILKISNNISLDSLQLEVQKKNKEIKEIKKEDISNLSYQEIINMIYKEDLQKTLNISGFKIVNKAPLNYIENTLLKIKNLKFSPGYNFLNKVNLEKDYYIDEYTPVVVEDVITREIHKIVDEYFKTNIKNGIYPFGDRQSQRYKIIDEIITRLLHLEFLPLIEKIVGKKMEPTYTYISAYVKGADLPAHTDRAECEFTCSYIIGKPIDSNWNIYVHKIKQAVKHKGRYAKFDNGDPGYTPPKEECVAVDCRENGIMIFNGTDHIHYREPLEHDYYNVVLLHYRSK